MNLCIKYAINSYLFRKRRGTNYGEEITSINGQLDPSHPNPVLSTNVYISDEDYRIASFHICIPIIQVQSGDQMTGIVLSQCQSSEIPRLISTRSRYLYIHKLGKVNRFIYAYLKLCSGGIPTCDLGADVPQP